MFILSTYNQLPLLPPPSDVETKRVLKACILARAALAELCEIGVLKEVEAGREKLFVNPKLLNLLMTNSSEAATSQPTPASMV